MRSRTPSNKWAPHPSSRHSRYPAPRESGAVRPARPQGHRVLESLGFAYVRTKGSHAIYRHPDGRAVVVPQHGTIKRGTLASILRASRHQA